MDELMIILILNLLLVVVVVVFQYFEILCHHVYLTCLVKLSM